MTNVVQKSRPAFKDYPFFSSKVKYIRQGRKLITGSLHVKDLEEECIVQGNLTGFKPFLNSPNENFELLCRPCPLDHEVLSGGRFGDGVSVAEDLLP